MSEARRPKIAPEAPIVGTPAARFETAKPTAPATTKMTQARAEP